MSVLLDPSALRDLAEQAPRNRSAFQRFSDVVLKASHVPVPDTIPMPSSDPNDPMNAAVAVLSALHLSISDGLIGSSTESTRFALKILPYMKSWITYFIHHIIAMGRTCDFHNDVGKLSSEILLVLLLHTNQHSPKIHQEVLSMKVVLELLRAASSSPHTHTNCFHIISELIPDTARPDLRNLPPHAMALSDALCHEYIAFTTAFQSCVIREIGVVNGTDDFDSQAYGVSVKTLAIMHRAMLPFMVIVDITDRLVQNEHLRWTCEMMHSVAGSKFFDRLMNPAQSNTVTENIKVRLMLTLSLDAVMWGGQHVVKLIDVFGNRAVKQAYDYKAIYSLIRAEYLTSKYRTVLGDKYRHSYAYKAAFLLQEVAPYLMYYSILTSALQVHRDLQRCLSEDMRASFEWKAYQARLDELLELKRLYQEQPVTICDCASCPNLVGEICPLKRCSGCGAFYYCSRACQKEDWKSRHRSICAAMHRSFNTNMKGTCSRDLYFFSYNIRDIMRSHVRDDQSLVREVDFTTAPVEIRLRPLAEYRNMPEYNHVAEFVRLKQGIPTCTLLPAGIESTKKLGCSDYKTLSNRGRIIYNPLISDLD
ncbi:hypothetical protein BDZ89DRAFT_1066892 [Hymenopellis radicata]|nr:hypothetical protein BDZ89DRAFT_1066892 [Hymenopellis radicata]